MIRDNCIGKVTAKQADRNLVRGRLRLEHLLNSVDFRPPELPPTAVLIVRRLTDPLPGQMASSRSAVQVKPQWETALRDQLARLAQQAIRPVAGRLPSQAEALLFTDEAEMLACLVLAIQRGEVNQRWWWQRLLRRFPAADLVALLAQRPRHVPAILHYLTAWQQAIPLITRLPINEIYTVYHSLGTVWPVPALPALDTRIEALTASLVKQRGLVQDDGPPELVGSPRATNTSPPWQGWVSPAELPSLGLSKEQALLLGVGLTLQRRPTAVSGQTFQRQLEKWWLAQETQAAEPYPMASAPSHSSRPITLAALHGTNSQIQAGTVEPVENPPKQDVVAAYPSSAREKETAEMKAVSNEVDTLSVALTAGVTTRLGGVFYLINLMLQLKLLEVFEAEWQLTSQIGAWGMLELLARGLLCDGPEELMADPLWAALAALNDRQPDEPLGKEYWAKGAKILPPEFAVSEPVGFSVTQLAGSPFLPGIAADLVTWLELVLPTIVVTLRRAIQRPVPASFSEVAEQVLLCDGRLFVTASHVDLIFNLDDVSLPLRLAGLDIDPGWVSAFGRVVQFHFE